MKNGFRLIIDRRGDKCFWSYTESGEQHESLRGYDTLVQAAEQADVFRRQLELARHFKAQKAS